MIAPTAELAEPCVRAVLATVWRFVKRAGHAFGMIQQAIVPRCGGGSDRLEETTDRFDPERSRSMKPGSRRMAGFFDCLIAICFEMRSPSSPGCGAIGSPSFTEGPINGDWVRGEEFLAPTRAPDGVVIADNLSIHDVRPARQLVEDAGAEMLSLSPYSLDLNPIEMIFRKLDIVPQGRQAHLRGRIAEGRDHSRHVRPGRVLALPASCRILFYMNANCSSPHLRTDCGRS